MHTQHAHDLEALSAYLDGELSDTQRAELERHLETCGRCQAELERMRAVVEQVRSLPRMSPAPYLPARIAALAERRSAWHPARLATVAALAVLVLGITFAVSPLRTPPSRVRAENLAMLLEDKPTRARLEGETAAESPPAAAARTTAAPQQAPAAGTEGQAPAGATSTEAMPARSLTKTFGPPQALRRAHTPRAETDRASAPVTAAPPGEPPAPAQPPPALTWRALGPAEPAAPPEAPAQAPTVCERQLRLEVADPAAEAGRVTRLLRRFGLEPQATFGEGPQGGTIQLSVWVPQTLLPQMEQALKEPGAPVKTEAAEQPAAEAAVAGARSALRGRTPAGRPGELVLLKVLIVPAGR